MLDINIIRSDPERVKTGLSAKGVETAEIDDILKLDGDIRSIKTVFEKLRAEINSTSKEIGKIKSGGGDITAVSARVRELREQAKDLETKQRDGEEALNNILFGIPNLPADDVPRNEDGAGETVREWGEKREFDFKPSPHWELGEKLDILDFPRGAKIGGSGFVLYKGLGARLQRALANFMLDLHVSEHGYCEVWPPMLANRKSMTSTGQLPKFENDMYCVSEDGYYLIPTAEVPLTNIFQGETLQESDLPIRFAGYSECFRREAGAAGKDTRGLIRLHEFSKVELVKFTTPETSYAELESLLRNAEKVLQLLKLPYRVLLLSSYDMSFASAKTYDLELWCPGVGNYQEVSSCSNFEDFQARRGNIRYKTAEGGKPRFVHTLNGSGVAFPRLVISILENYQLADGSVEIPEVLRQYFGGREVIAPEK